MTETEAITEYNRRTQQNKVSCTPSEAQEEKTGNQVQQGLTQIQQFLENF